MPRKFYDKAPKVVPDGEGGDAWQFSPELPPAPIGIYASAGRKHEDVRLARRQAERAQLLGTARGVLAEEILVELRRRNRGPGEHCVHLTAMVDLVLEEVREHVPDPFGMPCAVLAHEHDLIVRRGVGEALAVRDEPPVRVALRPVQVHEARKRLGIGVQRGTTAATLERVEIVPVDDQDVAQRGMDGREEARPRGASPGLGELAARVVQAMVRPRAVAGHLEKVHGERRHTPQLAAHDPRLQVEFAA